MININIIYVGNTKEKYYLDEIEEYKKRLSGYCKLELIEIKETKTKDNPTLSEISQAMESEGKKILPYLNDKTFVISLCVEGKEYDSMEFANLIDIIVTNKSSKISFVIGGPYGLSNEIKEKSDIKLSLSKMTFTHRLAKILLLEQIYRANNILAGGKYHK